MGSALASEGHRAQLVAVVGATGTGKSTLSLDLAEKLAIRGVAAEVINADAMQLYRGMDVGTAKVPIGDRRGIHHHLLDVLDPTEEASVARYQADARAAISGIRERGAVPILVGGSGLYLSSVLWDFRFPGTDAQLRERLEKELERLGLGVLFRRLTDLDPVAAAAIGPHNARRIVRALEVIELTGAPFGAGLPDESTLWMPTAIVGLTAARDELVPRLDDRVDGMWRNGLLDEAAALAERGLGATASRAIGYAQALAQLRGDLSEAEAIEQTKVLTRKYARRQVSWFKRYPATMVDHDDPGRVDAVLALLLEDA
ncbi:tRNA (adenosine(37)-N6)-dimethylallyltransferase MiaA [soil metagenome]